MAYKFVEPSSLQREYSPLPQNLDGKIKEVEKDNVLDITRIYNNLDKFRIPDKYKDEFTAEQVHQDMLRRDEVKQYFDPSKQTDSQKETNKLTKGFEYYLYENLGRMLGDEVEVFIPPDFDDLNNAADLVIKIKNTNHYLSVDATIGSQSDYKVKEIFQKYKEKKLYKVDYFIEKPFELSKLYSLPHAMLGIDRNSFERILIPWLRGEQNNPQVTRVLLEEGLMQFKIYANYLTEQGLHPDAIATLEAFNELFLNLLEKIESETEEKEDKVKTVLGNNIVALYGINPDKYLTRQTEANMRTKTPLTGRVIKIPRTFKAAK